MYYLILVIIFEFLLRVDRSGKNGISLFFIFKLLYTKFYNTDWLRYEYYPITFKSLKFCFFCLQYESRPKPYFEIDFYILYRFFLFWTNIYLFLRLLYLYFAVFRFQNDLEVIDWRAYSPIFYLDLGLWILIMRSVILEF